MRAFFARFMIYSFPAFFLTIGFIHPDVQAQYFGQNKVRYKEFHFKILKTEHFDIYFYPAEKAAAEQTARMAERWYARHSLMLHEELDGRQPLIIYSSHPDFEETNTTQSFLSEGVGGFTEPMKRRIVLPLGASLEETDHVVGHELVHAFQYNLTGENEGKIASGEMEKLPLWFIEGMAEFLSSGSRDPLTAMWMRDAIRHPKRLPDYNHLNSYEYFPYRYGQALLAYIAGRWGDEAIGDLLRASANERNIDQAIRSVLKTGPDTLMSDWKKSLHNTYSPFLTVTDTSYKNARLLINSKKGGGDLNVSPVLSPDGRYLIFFSEKDLFAIDLFLADARTGKVIRKLTELERDPHYESLEFISSAGTWNPGGDRIAISGMVKGKPVLTILDTESGNKHKEISFPDLKEIISPAWSPDGRHIAFSAIRGGHSDLFLYDLTDDSLHALTSDLYAELQPAWSPDGQQLVFVSDRGSLNLNQLNRGNYGLELYNLNDGSIIQFSFSEDGNQINPQWSADGQLIYFLSDISGIPNLYSINTNTQAMRQITNYFTGVSGITSLSPAFSVSQKTNRMVFSVFEDGNYSIYSMNPDTNYAAIQNTGADEINILIHDPAQLPPTNRKNRILADLLHNDSFGLIPDNGFTIKPYHPKLSLDYVGQPYVLAGGDRYGFQIGGGIGLYWSDMLGNNNLATMFQLESYRDYFNFAGLVGYVNRKSRWDWGGYVEQIPYLNQYYNSGYGIKDSSLVYVEQQERLRQMNRDISLFAAYPFNRESRIEFSGGFRHIGYDWTVKSWIYDPSTGAQIDSKTDHLPVPSPLNLATTAAAFVYDYSLMGATDPILGQRYRLEVAPVMGSINYYTVLADYRRYVIPVRPVTIAGRILHYGRYGGDSEDSRLLPLYIGYPNFVRGYDAGTFSAGECGPSGNGCQVYNSLFGSRMAVANIEVRAPLFGLFGLGDGYYGYLPLEAGLFYDTGVAWDKADSPSFLGGQRNLVKSYGATMRLNFFGYAVIQLSLVNPVDRPNKGWMWQFNFQPGF